MMMIDLVLILTEATYLRMLHVQLFSLKNGSGLLYTCLPY